MEQAPERCPDCGEILLLDGHTVESVLAYMRTAEGRRRVPKNVRTIELPAWLAKEWRSLPSADRDDQVAFMLCGGSAKVRRAKDRLQRERKLTARGGR
jgi:hypothetical protein